ncbi:MAG TPA: MerR family DNA-binding transcriptional regulator [Pseudonocardiaceae bacterium]|jgi:DNA-binding transcriptional MerR regulator|nr:MerR family DNA-binding transcriptional regulator [Pseudonocardiaceae bacterium]
MLRIGEVAELAGVSTRTIRHYHQIGLLPEPARMANGYRGYELRDVVVLLRVRRLAELGLRLDEVGGVLADDKGRELRDILVELDADLAEQERRIRLRRQRIAELLARADASTFSGELADLLADLERTPDDQPDAERLVAQMYAVMAGALTAAEHGAYRTVLADRDLADQLTALAGAYRSLAGLLPDDPAVADLAARAAALAPSVLALVPKEIRQADPYQPSDADPARSRCHQLLLQYLRDRA